MTVSGLFLYATKRIGIHLLSSRLYCRFWNYTKSYAVAFADYTAGRELHPALKIVYSTYGYIIHQEYVLVKYKEQKTLQRKENFLRIPGLFAGFPYGRCCGRRAFFSDLSACIVDAAVFRKAFVRRILIGILFVSDVAVGDG